MKYGQSRRNRAGRRDSARRAQTDDLAIPDGGHRPDAVGDFLGEQREFRHRVAASGDEAAEVPLDVGERAEAVVLSSNSQSE